jgi:DnaJ-class molecular chaperone
MNLEQTHLDIARERFLALMAAHPNGDPSQTAVFAIDQAGEFVEAYKVLSAGEPVRLKGCKQCYGSGGKTGSPCRSCDGSGKVAA